MLRYAFLFSYILIMNCCYLFGDTIIWKSEVHASYLKTVQCTRTDLALVQPAILFGSDDQLVLRFDDLRGSTQYYSYTFIHCDQNWQQSSLSYFDYLDGFERNEISDYHFSSATSQAYTHYEVMFPNDDVQFRVSGNYIIQVWEEGNDTIPVITERFYVWEDIASVDVKVMRPNMIPYRTEYQEINFTANIRNAEASNPYEDIKVTLQQNNRPDNAWYDLKPRFINNDVIYYDDDNTVLLAGKEYRRFDISTLRFQTDRIVKIEKGYKRYDVYINADENRSYKQYLYDKDVNGNFIVQAELTNDADIEADYAYVHFRLQAPYFITGGEMYVMGDFNNYTPSAENRMEYNYDLQQYEAVIYLKQGYYNYMYAFIDKSKPYLDFSYAEGNYFEAENDYSIFVYQHIYDRDYDRLIGYKVFNSLKQ